MGFYGVATLVTAAILASTSTLAVVDPNTPDFLTLYQSSAAVEGNAPIPRLLRSAIQVDNGEERAAWIEQFKNLFKSDDAIVKGLMSKSETPYDVERIPYLFGTHMPYMRGKTVGLNKVDNNALSDAKFRSWFKYITKTNKNNWETATISALREANTDAVVASMILAGKNGKNKAVAKKLEQAQFKDWLDAGYWPADVIEKVYKLGPVRAAYKKPSLRKGEQEHRTTLPPKSTERNNKHPAGRLKGCHFQH
ncbi:secreted RxLR effector peptide protein, putative [Phytophthora infestans T30-4]|uniref:Secreted RxLR effector peptide protein, putative n=1 Tax=Phytophthora infestans (strain T30-4) TaxID=403677 RepID=D0NM56_PHYIT|nr:secreted RxLR effector peptide protein, putative [Phytophthora infestans T30-4]EEY60777.1 secreted RxLR effector peptide protein, putative [Phytophthora infestans T30-4]|eukprot:XP_002899723.1 secreted RxLR effector peptide protein, putative [Phytophthora infestans T30-4]